MSVTGFWIVGVVPDSEIVRFRRAFPGHAAISSPAPGFTDQLDWWRRQDQAVTFFEPGAHRPQPTAGALRLHDLIDLTRAADEQAEAMKDELLNLVPRQEGADLFCAAARKGDPAAALQYALGPGAAYALPGWFGDFILDANEVRGAIPAVETALALPPVQRKAVEARITEWMSAMTDASDHGAGELIDGPLRVLRRAAEHGLGAVGLTRWY